MLAQPTIEEVWKEYSLVSPSKAQELYKEGKIDKKDFICASEGCSAPITCRQIDKPNVKASFIEGRRTKNLHTCEAFSNREVKKTAEKNSAELGFSVDFSGIYIGNSPRNVFTQGLGSTFLEEASPVSETTLEIPDDDNSLTSKSKIKRNKKNPSSNKKTYRKRISSMEDAVSLFEQNPNELIEEWFLGSNRPINRYFRFITSNHFQTKIKDDVPIYYGKGFIANTATSEYRFNFSCKKIIEGIQYRPHFYVSKEFIDQSFPFLTNRVHNNPRKRFNIYIRSRFLFYPESNSRMKLMFQHSNNELLNLIYFTDTNN